MLNFCLYYLIDCVAFIKLPDASRNSHDCTGITVISESKVADFEFNIVQKNCAFNNDVD